MRVGLICSSLLLVSLGLFGCGGAGSAGSDALSTGANGDGASVREGASSADSAVPGAGVESTVEETTEPEPTLVRYVSASGDDGGDGSEAAPWRTVANAVANAQPGTKIVVGAGSYDGVTIDGVDGTADAPIVIAGAEGERPIFTSPIQVQRAYWVFDGIEVASTEPSFSVRFTGAGAHDDVIKNSVVRDGTGAAGVSIDLEASKITVEGTEIFNISRGETDAHGIVVQPTVRDITLVGNEIHDNSGDSIQCIGPGQDAVEGAPANGLVIEGNNLYTNRENAVDIKHCENVEVRGNVMHGFRKSATSNGEAIVVHLLASNVTIEGNDISDSSRGVVTGRGAQNVHVRRNVIHDLADEKTGVIFGEGAGFEAVHNTIVGADRGLRALEGSGAPVVRNNIFDGCTDSVDGEANADSNLFSGSPAAGTNPVEGDAQLDGEYAPADGSPAVDAASPGDDADTCGAGADMGAIENC